MTNDKDSEDALTIAYLLGVKHGRAEQNTQTDALKIAREALEGWRTIYQLAPPHPDIAPDIWQGMIDRTAAALKESK